MRIPQRIPIVVYVVSACCSTALMFVSTVANADGAVRNISKSDADRSLAARFRNGPCGVRALRGQYLDGGGLDVAGAWRCARYAISPASLSDDESSRGNAAPKDGFNWGVRVRRDQVLLSIGLKWK